MESQCPLPYTAGVTCDPADTDNDGTPDYLDLDSDGDGISDNDEGACSTPFNSLVTCTPTDTDNDGIPDFLEEDADNDGIPDNMECPTGTNCVDTDGDGTPDYQDADSDGDGILDNVEATCAVPYTGAVCTPTDSDNDGTPDHLDLDSDGDGIPDDEECPGYDGTVAACDQDGDGIPNHLDVDSDGDGLPDGNECEGGPICMDTDNDGIPDWLDIDSDGDNIPDSQECPNGTICPDSDNDGTPDHLDLDSDGDGIADIVESECTDPNTCEPADFDNDGIPNHLDLDSDNDGLLDADECPGYDGTNVSICDVDNDGNPDHLDCKSAEIILTSTGPVCSGGDVQLFVDHHVINASYEWRIAGTSDIVSTNQNPIFTGIADTTIYEVTVIAGECISDNVATFMAVIYANPQVDPVVMYTLNPDCSPNDLVLAANITAGSGNVTSITWTGPNNWSSDIANPVIENVDASYNGTYTLIIEDEYGCSSSDFVNITTITDQVNVPQITGFGSVCFGERVTLTVPQYSGSTVTYTWTYPGTGDNISGLGTNEITINPMLESDEGDYTVTVVVDETCILTSNAYPVVVHDAPIVFVSNDGPECIEPQADINLTTVISNGSGDYTVAWTGPLGFTSVDQNPVIPNPTNQNSGTYTVTVTDLNGCTASASTVIDVTISPEAPTMTVNNNVICSGDLLRFEANTYLGTDVIYTWILNDNTNTSYVTDIPSLVLPAAGLNDAGQYRVYVTVDGCSSTPSAEQVIEINDQPTAPEVTSIMNVCEDDFIQLTTTTNAATYHWTGPNGFTSNVQSPTCLLYTSPSPRDATLSRMPSSA